HLVTVEVSVERRADQWVNLDGFTFHKLRLEGLNTQTVQRRRTVEQHRTFLDDFLKDFPHFWLFTLDDALGTLHVAGVVVTHQTADHERAVKLQCHGLRQTTLMQLQTRTDHDDRTARVVHTLTEQIATEAPLLTLQHIAQGLEFAATATAQRL